VTTSVTLVSSAPLVGSFGISTARPLHRDRTALYLSAHGEGCCHRAHSTAFRHAADSPDHSRIQGSTGASKRTYARVAAALGDEEDGTDRAFVTNPLLGGSSVSGRSSNAASCSNASACGSSRFRRRGRRTSSTASGGDGSSHRSGIAIGWVFPVRRVLNLPHVSDPESRHRPSKESKAARDT
jgi:hypothetical protein